MKEKIRKHIIGYSVLLSELIGLAISIFWGRELSLDVLGGSLLIGTFFVYPVILTLLNLFFCFCKTEHSEIIKKGKTIEYITIVLGFLYSGLVLIFYNIQFQADWTEILVNQQVHTPIWTAGYGTVIVLSCIGIAGYFFLSCIKINRMPPLVIVCAIAAMYLGVLQCILWIIQIFQWEYLWLCLFPFNCIILAAKTIRYKTIEWKEGQQQERKILRNKFLNAINQKLMESGKWPIAAFILMWPLLGIIICILALFGQQPDSIIKTWTETSDWNLSNRAAPQNIYYDEHYLCTVAAGGHEKIVKPIRLGERHGHPVIVNRQLCIANAFEQIVEERVPILHKHLRNFYDRYGFPVAKMIHSPYIADFIYFIMKPLEYVFLLVLYFCDVNPENRIAVQYIPRHNCHL